MVRALDLDAMDPTVRDPSKGTLLDFYFWLS